MSAPGPVMPAEGPIPRPRTPRPWWTWVLAAVVGLLVLGLVALVWRVVQDGRPAPVPESHPTAPLPTAAASPGSLPPPASTKTLDELALPDQLDGWQRQGQEPPRGAVRFVVSYQRDDAGLTVVGMLDDTLAHATAGLTDAIDGPSFRCSSTPAPRCWAQVGDGVVALHAPAGTDAPALMAALVATW